MVWTVARGARRVMRLCHRSFFSFSPRFTRGRHPLVGNLRVVRTDVAMTWFTGTAYVTLATRPAVLASVYLRLRPDHDRDSGMVASSHGPVELPGLQHTLQEVFACILEVQLGPDDEIAHGA